MLVHKTIMPMGSMVKKTNRQLMNSKNIPKTAIPIRVPILEPEMGKA
jgi:hypothetical protein